MTNKRQLSASQIESFRLCKRRWAWQYVEGVESSKENRFAAFGTGVHAVLAAWLEHGKKPDLDTEEGRVALPALKHLPAPNPDLFVESYLEVERPRARYRGFSDLTFFDDKLHLPVVHDHKSTVDFKWAKTEEDLREDPQAMIYALAAMDAFETDEAELRWGYVRTRGKPSSKLVKFRVHRHEAELAMVDVDDTAEEIYAAYEAALPALQTEYNANACDHYGGCPFKDNCNLSFTERIKSIMSTKSLAEKMKERKAAKDKEAKAAPPAAASAPATSKAEQKGEVQHEETAPINPPERAKASNGVSTDERSLLFTALTAVIDLANKITDLLKRI